MGLGVDASMSAVDVSRVWSRSILAKRGGGISVAECEDEKSRDERMLDGLPGGGKVAIQAAGEDAGEGEHDVAETQEQEQEWEGRGVRVKAFDVSGCKEYGGH